MSKYKALGLKNPKINTPLPEVQFEQGSLGVQEHLADKAGPHLDLRIALPQTGVAHSWAIPQAKMPEPGEKVLAVESGDHDIGYMNFSGVLTKGYGKGRVNLALLDKIEVLESDPNKITFAQYTGSGVNRYTLVRMTGSNWLLLNTTATNKTRPEIPQFKRSYNELSESQVIDKVRDPNTFMAPKIDGAHVVFGLRPQRRIDIFSYRPSRKGSELIDHSFKTDLYKHKSPNSLGKTVLRGELYGINPKTHKPLHSAETGGLLNSGTWRSRDMQKTQGKLTHLIYDIDTFKGKDVSQFPYSLKLELLKRVKQEMPELQIVQPARSYVEKSNLLDEVKSGTHPLSQEGVVVYDLHKHTPEKYKITKDIDVYFHSPFSPLVGSRLEQMGAAGGFYASRELGGEPNIRVGGGLSDELRREIAQHPERFRNKPAKIYIQEELRSGKVRMPILKEFRDYEMWKNKQAESSSIQDFAAGVDPTGVFTFKNSLGNRKNHTKHKAMGDAGGFLGGFAASSLLAAGGTYGLGKLLKIKNPDLAKSLMEGGKDSLRVFNPKAVISDLRTLPESLRITKQRGKYFNEAKQFHETGVLPNVDNKAVQDFKNFVHTDEAFSNKHKVDATRSMARSIAVTGGLVTGGLGGVLNATSAHVQYNTAQTVRKEKAKAQNPILKQAARKKKIVTMQQLFLENPTSDEQQSTLSPVLTQDSGTTGGLPNINQVKSASVVNIEDLIYGLPQTTKDKIKEALAQEKTSSILDPVQKTLCPDIFDITTNTLLPDAQLAIIKGLKTILGPELYKVKYVFLLGGSVSYQWTADTDIDVNVVIPAEYIPDHETYGLYQTKMKSFKTLIFKGHPVSYTLKVESGTELEDTDNTLSIFDVLNNTWIKTPDPRGVDMKWMLEINKPYLNLYSHFLRSGVRNLLRAVKRGENPESLVERAIDVSEAYKNVDRARKLSYQESFGIPNLSQANVAYKFLTKDPLIHKIEDIYHAIKPKLLKAWYS